MTTRPAAWIVVAAITLAACGSNGGGDKKEAARTERRTTETTADKAAKSTTTVASGATGSTVRGLSKADYIAQADAICTAMHKQTDALPDPGTDPKKLADTEEQSAGFLEAALVQLRALPKPPGDEADIDTIYATVDSLVHAVRRDVDALRAGDGNKADAAAADMSEAEAQANKLSKDYGFKVCGA